MKLNAIRMDFETFSEEMAMEYYLEGSGLKNIVNFATIYKKYGTLFSHENLAVITCELEKNSECENNQRKNKMLIEAFFSELLNKKNYKLYTDYLNRQSLAKIKISESKIVSYRGSAIAMINEHSHDKRESIRAETEKFVHSDLNPLLKNIHEKERTFITTSGFKNKISMFEYFSEISLTKLRKLMRKFLRDTENIYVEYISKMAKKKLNLNLDEMYPHDLNFIIRNNEFDSCFSSEKIMPFMKSCFEKMGIEITAGNKIIFDIEARENKSARAFCTPVRIPNEIYLVLYPKGGQREYKTFLHELGHSLHYANIDIDLEFEYKRFGDNSVTEGFAMTMDHLMMNESWMDMAFNINMNNNREYFVNAAINELVILRRYAAKIEYEILLNETEELQDKREIYKNVFENALKINHSLENYLIDVDPYFYCSRYLRGWMFQANIHKYLNEINGKNWFENVNSGDFLKSLWKLGQRYNADELLKNNDCDELSIKPLYDNIMNVLSN